MGMSGLFDCIVRVYRSSDEDNIGELGDVDQIPTFVCQNDATVQLIRDSQRDEGAGDRPVGSAWLYIEKRTLARDNDVIQVIEGPNNGTYWTLSGLYTPSRSRFHKEGRLTPHVGPRPDA